MSNDTSQSGKKSQKQKLVYICKTYSNLINAKKSLTLDAFKENFKQKFHVAEAGKGVRVCLEETEGKVLQYTHKDALISAIIQFGDKLPSELLDYKLVTKEATQVRDYWIHLSSLFPVKEIKPVLQKSTPGHCFHRLDFDMANQETPLFDDFLDHIETNKDAFLAYIGMLFDPTAPRQQYLWLHGEGGDGKGVFCRFLRRLFADAYVALSTNEKQINQFFTSRLVSKRVGVFQDCHSPGFVQSEIFMMLSGGDPVFIEGKNKDGYTDEIPTMFVFSSNDLPKITGSKAHMRRAVIASMRERTTYNGSKLTYEDRFWEERAGILHKCWQAWIRHKAENGCVIADQEIVHDVASATEEKWDSIFHDFFKPTDDDVIGLKAHIFAKVLRNHAKMFDIEIANFKKFIERKYKITLKQHRSGELKGQRFYLRCALAEKFVDHFTDENTPSKF